MLKNSVRAIAAPRIQFTIKFFNIFAALVGLTLLPALAQPQSFSKIPNSDSDRQQLLSLQTARPDIFSMRGGLDEIFGNLTSNQQFPLRLNNSFAENRAGRLQSRALRAGSSGDLHRRQRGRLHVFDGSSSA